MDLFEVLCGRDKATAVQTLRVFVMLHLQAHR
jgi:hypothetical protein